MVECEDCGLEMDSEDTESCNLKYRCIKIDGIIYPRDVGSFDYNERCHDCNILNRVGNLHHFGCNMERCPACGGQLISCSCKKEAIGVNRNWKEI
jgi:rRNA maturation endonuclease Nob1